jgi:hypothetical protein
MDLSHDVRESSLRPSAVEVEHEHRAATSASPAAGAGWLPQQGLRPQLRLVSLVCLPVLLLLVLVTLVSSASRQLTAVFSTRDVLLVEDGAKLLGIALWTAFFAVVCAAALRVGHRRVKQ